MNSNELNERIENLKREQEKNIKKIEDAKIAQEEAEKASKAMAETIDKIEIAKNKLEEFEKSIQDIGDINVSENKNDVVQYHKKSNKNVKNVRFMAGFLSGAVGFAILTGAYVLIKKNHSNSIVETPVPLEEEITKEDKEITKKDLNNLSNSLIKSFKEHKLTTEENDIKRLVYAFNINQIATYHPEYIEEMIDGDSIEEVSQDFNQALMDLNTYNGNIYRRDGNTDNFIYISSSIFDLSDKTKLKQVEDAFNDIAVTQDNVELNNKVRNLLEQLMLPDNELANIESGPGYATYTMIELIRDLFMDRLDDANKDLIMYFVPYANDDSEHLNNNRHVAHLCNVEYLIENPYSLVDTKKLINKLNY